MRVFKGRKYKILICDSVIQILSSHKQEEKDKYEVGGILLGQVKGNEIYILRLSTPNKYDNASKYGFVRDKDMAQIIVDYEFINSNKKTIYLGEWHTHPEDFPKPSNVDRKMMKDQFQKNTLNEPYLILAIQGHEELYLGLFNGKRLYRLKSL